ncbi:MAG: phospholipid-binding protein [Cyanobacteria bacterium J06632_22]
MSVRKGGPAELLYQSSVRAEVSRLPLWFRGIPPERVGLNGEYDYYGLAKRVRLHLRETIGWRLMQTLRVSQRGRVVVLAGILPSTDVLEQVIQQVSGLPGVDMVEAQAVRLEVEMLVSA